MGEISMFFWVEIIGTIAFSCSGAMIAVRKKLDLLGVVVLGVTTACGGGMLRDIIIGKVPPTLFLKPVYVITAATTALVIFFFVWLQSGDLMILSSERYEAVLNLFDAIGLGAFTVVGIDVAIGAGYEKLKFLAVFLGVITGVGGGILRDMMAGQTPYVLRKHVYACASIAGALAYVELLHHVPDDAAILGSAGLVVLIRILARKYKWNLPSIGPQADESAH